MMLLKCCTQYASKFRNSAGATGLEKVSFHSNPKERQCQRMLKLLHNCTHFIRQQGNAQNPSSQTSTVCEPRTSRCQAVFINGRRTRDQTANIHQIIDKAREFQKNIYFCFIDYAKAFVWITTNCGISLMRFEYQHITCLLRNMYASQEATFRMAMGQQAGSKLGKEYIKAVYC